ncbi:MAG TPA: hypothetical protein VKU90_01795 [Caulobacteraceae bacterium]|nr:hypothetical protein [Caulobacteraceae bacterium]
MHLLLIKHVIHLTAVWATPICGGIAIIKGGRPERIGAAVFVGALLLTDVFEALAGPMASKAVIAIAGPSGWANTASTAYIDLVSTALMSAFFLYLAIRYASLWLAAAMIIHASELYFARLYIDSGFTNFTPYAIELNLNCALVLITLAAAALVSWRGRVVKRKEDAKRETLVARRREEQERRWRVLLESRPPTPIPAPAPGRVARLIIEPPPI